MGRDWGGAYELLVALAAISPFPGSVSTRNSVCSSMLAAETAAPQKRICLLAFLRHGALIFEQFCFIFVSSFFFFPTSSDSCVSHINPMAVCVCLRNNTDGEKGYVRVIV